MVLILFILFSGCFISYIVKQRVFILTSTMAVVMALGILTQGVLLHFLGINFIKTAAAHLLLAFILALWLSFWVSILFSAISGKWTMLHYSNPVNRFGMGTWVAASSISGILISKHFPQLGLFTEILAYLNTAFWLFYILISMQAFIVIFQKKININVHGILLLTTVSTQSLILLFHTVFESVHFSFTIGLLAAGFSFYGISLFLILKRYLGSAWSIEKDWNNTNCIIHGALSITGMASIVSGIANERSLLVLWIATAMIFLIVEAIEIYRLSRLVRRFGWRDGAGVYDVSQWSRIFTFAMFYTFTASIPAANGMIASIQVIVGQIGIGVILALVIIELTLALQNFIPSNDYEEPLRKSS